jgi:RimJ/RimL family protein N-acetyltransferase
MAVELRPLSESDYELLRSLDEQDDVWESVGALPFPGSEADGDHLFALVEGQVPVGIGGLVRSQALEGRDFEVLCALKEEAQLRGLATQACQRIIAWAFDTAKLERVIACIDDQNEGARTIAAKIGMKELAPFPPGRTVYVKYRDAR